MAPSAMSTAQNAPESSVLRVHSSLSSGASPSPAVSSATSQLAVSTTDPSPALSGDALRSPRTPSLPSSLSDLGYTTMPFPSSTTMYSASSAVNGDGFDDVEVPEAILEALRSPKERLYMLKLGESMESLVNERSPAKPYPRMTLYPSTSYQRLLIHKSSAYHRIMPEVETATKTISLIVTAESRVPIRRICDLVPADTVSSLPTFKIMRRNTPEQRTKSRNVSVPTPPSSSAADVSPSVGTSASTESGSPPSADGTSSTDPTDNDDTPDAILRSLGLPTSKQMRGNGTTTPRKTIEEREAAYNEARNRIFMDFEEKERAAAKLREDREREREVTEMHRKLAEEEDSVNVDVHELPRSDDAITNSMADIHQPNFAMNGHSHTRPSVIGPPTAEQDGPLRIGNGVANSIPSKGRDRAPASAPNSSLYMGVPNGSAAPDSQISSDSTAPLVSYPTLYDPDSNHDANGPVAHAVPVDNQPYPIDIPTTSYEPGVHPYGPSPQSAHPPYSNNPYAAYQMGIGGMPPMTGAPPMMMTGYPYPGVHNQQQQQPPQPMPVGPTMMGGISYQYYPQMGHPPSTWGDNHGGFQPGAGLDGQPPSTENGYGMYGSHMQHPQQQTFWPPQHLSQQHQLQSQPQQQPHHPRQPGQPHDMPPPPMANQKYQVNGHNGPNYPPHMPYFNPALQQQPYQQQQQQHKSLYAHPLPPHQQYSQPYHPNQRGSGPPPPPQQQRQLWNPSNGNGKRDSHPRGSFPNPGPPPQQQQQQPPRSGSGRAGPSNTHVQPGSMAPPSSMPNGNQRSNGGGTRGPLLRDIREHPRESNGPASLIATPMNSRSCNPSVSTGSTSSLHVGMGLGFGRNVWTLGNSPNGLENLPPLVFEMGRSTGSASSLALSTHGPGWSRGSRSGSVSGSVSENISVVGDDTGTRTPLDETASMASSSRSSASSSRTYTSTSSKHPSLPPRPDWVLGLAPSTHGFPSSSPSISSHSSHQGKSGSSSSSSNPAHSRTHSFQSNGRSPYVPQSTDFPPLPGVPAGPPALSPQRSMINPPIKNTVWGNTRPALLNGQSASMPVPGTQGPSLNRFEEHEGKISRPVVKGPASLFDPKTTGKNAAVRSSTPVVGQPAASDENGDGAAAEAALVGRIAQLEVTENQAIPPAGPSA